MSFLLSPETTEICYVITYIISKFILKSFYTVASKSVLIYSFNCA